MIALLLINLMQMQTPKLLRTIIYRQGWMGLDIAEQSIDDFGKIILGSKIILWNGPMGVFEMEKFQNGTKAIADL